MTAMFSTEQEAVTREIQAFLDEREIPGGDELDWSPIPFTGEWGIATSFFKAAAAEVKDKKLSIPVPHRAQEIANEVADHLGVPAGFARVEAVAAI